MNKSNMIVENNTAIIFRKKTLKRRRKGLYLKREMGLGYFPMLLSQACCRGYNTDHNACACV